MGDRTPTPGTERWEGERARRWVAQAAALDRQLAPVTEVLMATAAPSPGERVLDVGCGTGPTTRLAARACGPNGSVVGLDVAPEMLEAARAEGTPNGSAPIEWLVADATTWDGAGDPFDLVLSRFGVMFFDDPPAAFRNLHARAAAGGRLVCSTWHLRDRSELFELPLQVVLEACDRWGLSVEPPPNDDRAFSLHPEAVVPLLQRAGWRDASATPHELRLPAAGGATPADAAAASLEIGPARAIADHLDASQRAAIIEQLTEVYAARVDEDGHVMLPGTIVLVTARR